MMHKLFLLMVVVLIMEKKMLEVELVYIFINQKLKITLHPNNHILIQQMENQGNILIKEENLKLSLTQLNIAPVIILLFILIPVILLNVLLNGFTIGRKKVGKILKVNLSLIVI